MSDVETVWPSGLMSPSDQQSGRVAPARRGRGNVKGAVEKKARLLLCMLQMPCPLTILCVQIPLLQPLLPPLILHACIVVDALPPSEDHRVSRRISLEVVVHRAHEVEPVEDLRAGGHSAGATEWAAGVTTYAASLVERGPLLGHGTSRHGANAALNCLSIN